jgi:hypothetical protein
MERGCVDPGKMLSAFSGVTTERLVQEDTLFSAVNA